MINPLVQARWDLTFDPCVEPTVLDPQIHGRVVTKLCDGPLRVQLQLVERRLFTRAPGVLSQTKSKTAASSLRTGFEVISHFQIEAVDFKRRCRLYRLKWLPEWKSLTGEIRSLIKIGKPSRPPRRRCRCRNSAECASLNSCSIEQVSRRGYG